MTHYGPEPLPDPTPPREWRYHCGRCGNMTDGHREGGVEHCTACGGVLGPADEIENVRRDRWKMPEPHDPDADPCRCADCSEVAWDRLQEAQAESPSEWNQAYKGPIDKREMRRRE